MRILYLGNFSETWSTENYIARALERLGHEVTLARESPDRDALCALEDALHGPCHDLFLFAKGRLADVWDHTGQQMMRLLKSMRRFIRYTACWVFDLLNPDFSADRYEWAAKLSDSPYLDRFYTTDGSTLPFLGKNARLLRQGIGDDVRPGVFRGALAADIVFPGTVYGPRKEWVKYLERRFGRRFWACQDVRGEQMNDLAASCQMMIGLPTPHYRGYWSNRVYVATGYGAAFGGRFSDELQDEGWVVAENFIALDCSSMEGFGDSIERAVAEGDGWHDGWREDRWIGRVARRGAELTRSKFTYDERCRWMINDLQQAGK